MKLAWGAKVSPQFREKVIAISMRLGVYPSWLMAVMAFETGRTFSPSVKNATSGATGLIQFMPSTAIGLGTTVEDLAQMTAEDQLDYVEKYLSPFTGRLTTLPDLYMAVLWPKGVGGSLNKVIFPAGSREYLANRGLDFDGDEAVTKEEAASFVVKQLEEGFKEGNAFVDDSTIGMEQPAAPIEDRSTVARPEDIERITGQETKVLNPLMLIPALLEVFRPLIAQKIGKALDNKEVGEQVANNLLLAAQTETGKADPLDAVAAVRADPEIAAKVEQRSIDYLAQIQPFVDKALAAEREMWAAEEQSRAAAADRARTDSVDLAPFLAWSAILMSAGIMLLLITAMILQVIMLPSHEPSTAMLTLVGPLLGVIFSGAFAAVYGYRFGSSRSSGAKDALIGEIAARRSPGTGSGNSPTIGNSLRSISNG